MFADISSWIVPNPAAHHCGVAVADLHGDGRWAVLVANLDGPNRLLRWTGQILRDVAPPAFALPEAATLAVAAADLDGDGREEVYVHNCDYPGSGPRPADSLFRLHPDGYWDDLFERPEHAGVRNFWPGRSVAAIDRRGVGRYGFCVASYGKPLRLYEWTPQNTLADLAPSLGLALVSGGRGLLTAALSGDATDLLCINEHGPNWYYRNRGDGSFLECASAVGLDDPREHGRGVAPFDAGGQLGIAWGNWDGPHRLMVPQSDGTWRNAASAGFAFPTRLRNLVVADFDNDGYEEIFLHNHAEPNRLFRLIPPARAGEMPELVMLDPGAAADPAGCGTAAAVLDVDGDGIVELLVACGEQTAQPLRLYKAVAASGRSWLRIRPLTRFLAPARGAVVRAVIDGRVRVRSICGGSGYLGQSEPVAHFGLGHAAHVERVEVVWPDGAAVVLLNPRPNRLITVPYPQG